jgi:hypothetical protein
MIQLVPRSKHTVGYNIKNVTELLIEIIGTFSEIHKEHIDTPC